MNWKYHEVSFISSDCSRSHCFQGPDLGLEFLALPPGACDTLVPSRPLANGYSRVLKGTLAGLRIDHVC